MNHPDILIVAPPSSRRVRAYQASLEGIGLRAARVLPWTAVIAGEPLTKHVREGTILRLESPGEDWDTERAFLEQGDIPDEEGDCFERVDAATLEFDLGRLVASRQWFLGFRRVLERVKAQLTDCAPHRLMQHPDDIVTMFDKRATHARLEANGIVVPSALPPISSFDELFETMRAHGAPRVFVKLAHGSGASGAVALQTHARRWHAVTTVVTTSSGLYNSRVTRTLETSGEIRRLIDVLCKHRVHVERWLPKAGFDDRTFDLRVVVIGQQAKQVLVRLARGPITNLHLGNERGDWEAVREALGDSWHGIRESCERAAALFPNSVYAGVDALVQPGFSRHAILELNAFGDYHRNVFVHGLDTYQTQLEAMGFEVKR